MFALLKRQKLILSVVSLVQVYKGGLELPHKTQVQFIVLKTDQTSSLVAFNPVLNPSGCVSLFYEREDKEDSVEVQSEIC